MLTTCLILLKYIRFELRLASRLNYLLHELVDAIIPPHMTALYLGRGACALEQLLATVRYYALIYSVYNGVLI